MDQNILNILKGDVNKNMGLHVIGNNAYNQALAGSTANITKVTQVPLLTGVRDMAASNYCMGVIPGFIGSNDEFSTNTLLTRGGNFFGLTGLGVTTGNTTELTDTELGLEASVEKVDFGIQHAMAVAGGALYSWGGNTNGRTGQGTVSGSTTTPTQVGSSFDWERVACGNLHTIGIEVVNLGRGSFISTIQACGFGGNGRLGNGSSAGISQLTMTDVSNGISPLNAYKSIAAGDAHSAVIDDSGQLYTCGSNANGRTGQGTASGDTLVFTQVGTDTDWARVVCGYDFTLALKTDGTIWGFGNNNKNQIGSANSSENSPVQIGSDSDWIDIAAGSTFSMFIKADGSEFSWGDKSRGTLWGLGENIDNVLGQPTPGTTHGLILVDGRPDSYAVDCCFNGATAFILKGQAIAFL